MFAYCLCFIEYGHLHVSVRRKWAHANVTVRQARIWKQRAKALSAERRAKMTLNCLAENSREMKHRPKKNKKKKKTKKRHNNITNLISVIQLIISQTYNELDAHTNQSWQPPKHLIPHYNNTYHRNARKKLTLMIFVIFFLAFEIYSNWFSASSFPSFPSSTKRATY